MKTEKPWPFAYCLALFVFGVTALQTSASPLEDLDHEDYAVRQAATSALMLDESLSPGQLAAWYALTESPEVQQRLLTVARHHLIRTMRNERFPAEGPGVMGILPQIHTLPARQVGNRPEPPRKYVLIGQVLEGFPAAGRLEPMDHIIAFNDKPISSVLTEAAFGEMIRQHRAGEQIELTIRRNHQILQVSVPLANSNALEAVYATSNYGLSAEFDRAWTQYRNTHFTPLRP